MQAQGDKLGEYDVEVELWVTDHREYYSLKAGDHNPACYQCKRHIGVDLESEMDSLLISAAVVKITNLF